MAYNTKTIVRDFSNAPVPQFYNPTTDTYQPLTGVDLGSGRYATDGLLWGKTAAGLYVPVKVDDDGKLNVACVGTILEDETILTEVNTATEDASLVVGIDAVPSKRHYITAFSVVLSGAACESEILIELIDDFGGTSAKVLWRDVIGIGSPAGTAVGVVLTKAIPGSIGKMVVLKTNTGAGLATYQTGNIQYKTV